MVVLDGGYCALSHFAPFSDALAISIRLGSGGANVRSTMRPVVVGDSTISRFGGGDFLAVG